MGPERHAMHLHVRDRVSLERREEQLAYIRIRLEGVDAPRLPDEARHEHSHDPQVRTDVQRDISRPKKELAEARDGGIRVPMKYVMRPM